MNGPPPIAVRVAGAALHGGCTTLALANLPAHQIPWQWLLAFVLPGAALGLLTTVLRHRWPRALLGIVLQGGACWLALALAPPMARPAALACTILPPLGFASLRLQPADQALALFLSFCVLLVGVILDGVHAPLLAAFGITACLALRCQSHLAALAAARPAPGPGAVLSAARAGLGGVALSAACLAVVFAVERTLAWLPPLTMGGDGSRATASAPTSTPRRVGLGDSFVLGSGGALLELAGEQLVRVRDTGGRPLPDNLYLRSGFFAVAALDRWQTGPLAPLVNDAATRHPLRPEFTGLPVHEFELDRQAAARNFVFAPPSTCEVIGIDHLLVDPAREWLRQEGTHAARPYRVRWQPLPAPRRGDAIVRQGHVAPLLALPPDLDRGRCQELLARWGVPAEPVAAMERIAAGLAGHCRYDRREPGGPFPTAIENFLFAADDRRGYCMHFAAAAALLLRLRGVPCRIGVGLYGGNAVDADASARDFGSQHAHAWVEVPFAGRGYVVFDPTPPAERGRGAPQAVPAPATDAAPGQSASGWSDDLAGALAALAQQPWLPASLLLALLAWVLATRRARPPGRPAAPATQRAARQLLAQLLQALAAAGHPRRSGETLERLLQRIEAVRPLPAPVHASFVAYQQVRFGGRPFDAGREQVLRAGIAAARALPPLALPAAAMVSSS